MFTQRYTHTYECEDDEQYTSLARGSFQTYNPVYLVNLVFGSNGCATSMHTSPSNANKYILNTLKFKKKKRKIVRAPCISEAMRMFIHKYSLTMNGTN